jgi:cyclin-dependent kinase 12/13
VGQDRETNEIVALKRINTEQEENGFPITAIREVKILRALRHPNIVNLKEIVTSKGTLQTPDLVACLKVIPGFATSASASFLWGWHYLSFARRSTISRVVVQFNLPKMTHGFITGHSAVFTSALSFLLCNKCHSYISSSSWITLNASRFW